MWKLIAANNVLINPIVKMLPERACVCMQQSMSQMSYLVIINEVAPRMPDTYEIKMSGRQKQPTSWDWRLWWGTNGIMLLSFPPSSKSTSYLVIAGEVVHTNVWHYRYVVSAKATDVEGLKGVMGNKYNNVVFVPQSNKSHDMR